MPRAIVRPLERFTQAEAAGGILMLVAAVAAIVWANSPWHEAYHDLWETVVKVELGDFVHLDLDLKGWVDDGLMAIFFFAVGLEIKRELVVGELRDPKAAAMPVVAALGGMIVPALIFLLFNAGEASSKGWGIPMATDIAFAVGVVSLLGKKVPVAAKLFLLALAIVDDLGAIIVIAVFYTEDLSFGWLSVAIVAIVVAYIAQRVHVRWLAPYLLLGALCWLALHESGVHATLSGVAFGLLTPVRPFLDRRRFRDDATAMVEQIDAGFSTAAGHGHGSAAAEEEAEASLADLARFAQEMEAPLDRIEQKIVPWSVMVIVPLFALANAGVEITGDVIRNAGGEPVVLGVGLGLLVGKTVGVFGASLLAVKTGLGRLPTHSTWRHMFGMSMLAGIGFTVALFVTNLSFTSPKFTDEAKIAILGASLLAGILGYTFLSLAKPVPQPDVLED